MHRVFSFNFSFVKGMALLLLLVSGSQARAVDQPFVLDVRNLQCLPDATPECQSEYEVKPIFATISRSGSKCRYVTENATRIGSRWFDSCEGNFVNQHVKVCLIGRDDRLGCGLIDRDGEIVVPLVYEDVRFDDGLSIVAVKYQGKWGYFSIDRERLLLTPQFSEASDFSEGLAYVKLEIEEPEGNSWIINDQGLRVAVLPRQIEIKGKFVNGLAPAELDGKWGFINQFAEWAIPPQFSQVTEFSAGIASVKYQSRPELWAVIDTKGAGLVFFEGGPHRLGPVANGLVPLTISCPADDTSQVFTPCRNLCIDPDKMKRGKPCESPEVAEQEAASSK